MDAGTRRARRQDLPIRAEINVTSLVDVAFTLLVIFIITAPMLQGGVEIQVPEADVVITNPTHFAIALRFDADDVPADPARRPEVAHHDDDASGPGFLSRVAPRALPLSERAGLPPSLWLSSAPRLALTYF